MGRWGQSKQDNLEGNERSKGPFLSHRASLSDLFKRRPSNDDHDTAIALSDRSIAAQLIVGILLNSTIIYTPHSRNVRTTSRLLQRNPKPPPYALSNLFDKSLNKELLSPHSHSALAQTAHSHYFCADSDSLFVNSELFKREKAIDVRRATLSF
jgi:hypothetical protein